MLLFNQEQVLIWVLFFSMSSPHLVWVLFCVCPKDVLWIWLSPTLCVCVSLKRYLIFLFYWCTDASYSTGMRVTIQKALTEFHKKLSNWLQCFSIDPENKNNSNKILSSNMLASTLMVDIQFIMLSLTYICCLQHLLW